MPYRIDLKNPPDEAFDRLLDLGALDVESMDDGNTQIRLKPDPTYGYCCCCCC